MCIQHHRPSPTRTASRAIRRGISSSSCRVPQARTRPYAWCFPGTKGNMAHVVGVMINRVAQLGMVRDRAETYLWVQYGRRGWQRWEPLDDELEV
jgi:hypothetical protein